MGVEVAGEEEEADLEVLEISHPKVEEVLIVLDEDEEDKAGFDCILEKVVSSPEKVEPAKVEEKNVEIASVVELPPGTDSHQPKISVSKSFEEEFSKFSQQKATPAESEVDSDCTGGKEPEGNFSADDENDEESGAETVLVANSSAWSSLSLILEPQQEQSPSKTKVKRKTRKSLSRATPVKEKDAVVPKKKSPTPETSGSKSRYRRSSKMSSLIAEATDTDDQSPVRPAGRISQLLLTKSHKDQIEAKQENLKKEEEVKTNDRDGKKGEKRKSGSLANTSALKAKDKAEIKESMERETKTEKLIRTTKNA